jgi:hypothetical protein
MTCILFHINIHSMLEAAREKRKKKKKKKKKNSSDALVVLASLHDRDGATSGEKKKLKAKIQHMIAQPRNDRSSGFRALADRAGEQRGVALRERSRVHAACDVCRRRRRRQVHRGQHAVPA